MLKRLKLENFDLSSLKYITQAGGPLSSKLIKFFHNSLKKKKIKIYNNVRLNRWQLPECRIYLVSLISDKNFKHR